MILQDGWVRVAAAQFSPRLGDIPYNLAQITAWLERAVEGGADLTVFPECALTGYVVSSGAEARALAQPLDGEAIRALIALSAARQTHCVIGTLLAQEERVYNAALLIGPLGLIGLYHKAHLPFCGADRYIERGDAGFHVFDTQLGRIGLLICYDLRFPEAARTLALRGADMIALPTNWPTGAETAPEFMARARAFENRVFVIACNRVGVERGVRFIGRSCIVSPAGRHLADASPEAEEIIFADIKPAQARAKRLIVTPGEFEMDFFGDRRPELYD
ncbi:MAG: carbon-nitrogen hydrolase family protein [Anaerolineae bacterium]|nr:carbon-nitrogen hydrolase family protein [Thermoflexales bacterium]MDW8407637.1 carbon-nitrogen hydrolase family protein [Anaerolineae bacterium]